MIFIRAKKVALSIIVVLIMIIPISTQTNAMLYENLKEQYKFSNDFSAWWWEPVELLTAEFDNTNYISDMAIDADNNLHVITYGTDDLLSSGTDRDVFYRKYDYELKSWSELELVSEGSSDYSEISVIAVDPLGTVHIAWREGDDILSSGLDPDIFYRQKTSSGWGVVEVVSTESVDVSVYLAIVADSNGFAHVVWEDPATFIDADADQDILYKYRTAAGVWSVAEMVSDLSTMNAYLPEIQLDSQENIIIAWHDSTNIIAAGADTDIFFRKLDSDLTTWSSTQLISSVSDGESYKAKMSTSTDGMIHLVWYDYTDYLDSGVDFDIFHRKYNPNSNSWSITDVISTESTGNSWNLEIEIDGTDYLYLAWQDTTDVGGPSSNDNIFFKYLDLNTNIWSSLSVLTYDHEGIASFPVLAVDSLGHVHMIFLDTSSILGAGPDQDLFYKKFVGAPMQPILEEINPNPSSVGNIALSWSAIQGAKNFSIYRETSPFSSVTGLIPIATTNNSYFTDTVDTTGIYYYAIVATNDYGDSLISNTVFVEVVRGTGFFASLELSEILVFAGIVLGFQLIFSVLTYALLSSKIQSTSRPKSGKKK
ncbi:MAG: hypothetical protein HGN29_08880 [Asgard group archaeon]|nr:hypothetical protein [Asgard group archaeon]